MANKNKRGIKSNFSFFILHLSLVLAFTAVASADFTRDGSTNIVTDNTTGLQWQDDVNISKNWTDAIAYCETLTLGTYNDWRLPNINELHSVTDRSKRNPAMNSAFQSVVSNRYWSSSTVVGAEDSAWYVYFDLGNDNWYNKSNSYYVRCVRDGQ